MTAQLRVLGRGWCHLCDDLLDELMLLAICADVSIVVDDVDDFPELEDAWGEKVPVLFGGDRRELCHYHLDARVVHAYLAQFPIKSPD
jgi:thioredoxin reductase (NADPH)